MCDEEYLENLERRKEEQLPIMLTPAEVMDILGVGKNTIYRLLNSGELHGVRIGRSWRVANSALEKFVVNGSARPMR